MRVKIKHSLTVLAVLMLFLAPMQGLAYVEAPSPPTMVVQLDEPSSTVAPLQPVEDVAIQPEATATSEIPVAPKLKDIPGLITQVIELIKGKQWPAAIALMIVILMGILKLDFVGNLLTKYVPKRILPLIPLALGAISGAIYGFISGGWPEAAQVVVESGVLAIVFHQVWSHTVVRKDKDDG